MSGDKHKFFKVAQKIILSNKSNKLLIVKEKSLNTWSWPGGRLHDYEDWEEGLRREVKEELGTDDFKITGIYTVRTWMSNAPHYAVYFLGQVDSNLKITPNPEEILDYAWVSLKNITDFDYIHEGMKRDITDILNNL